MAKMIKNIINCCFDCPDCRRGDDDNWCFHPKVIHREELLAGLLEDINIIPKWCPLPDAVKEL